MRRPAKMTFKIKEIGTLPEGSVGLVRDKDGNVVQAFLRKQYHEPDDPTFSITEYPYGDIRTLDRGPAHLLSRDAPVSLVSLIEDEDFDWEDEAELEKAADQLDEGLAAAPVGSVALVGDPRTPFSSFVLALKMPDGTWEESGCGCGTYETTNLVVPLVNMVETDEEADAGLDEYEGSIEVFPYVIDTSIPED